MSRNNATGKKKITFSSLMENNKVVFVFSLIIAIICWCGVSIFQTPTIEKTFNNIKVNISTVENKNEEGETTNELEVFGTKDFTVSVTVKGLSYIVNSSSFSAENIVVTASSAAVSTAGTYDLPLSASITGAPGDIEIVGISENSIKVKFDKKISQTFGLTPEIVELDDYSLAPGCIRENPHLDVSTLEITGPEREMSKITGLKARIEIGGALDENSKVDKEAQIIAESDTGTVDLSDFTFSNDKPIFVRIRVSRLEKVPTAVNFIGKPSGLEIEYTVDPAEIDSKYIPDLGIESEDSEGNEDGRKFIIGNIDFSTINNSRNRIVIPNKNSTLDRANFIVTINMSSMYKRWLEVPVDVTDAKLPDNITVVSQTIKSVQIIGPESSVKNLSSSAAYAEPIIDGELTPGKHTVDARIILRTLTDSWVYGTYKMDIMVADSSDDASAEV